MKPGTKHFQTGGGDLAQARFERLEKENLGHWLASVGRELCKKRDDISVRLRHHKGRLVLIVKEKAE